MCGIIGGITRKNFSSDLLLKTIGHRGPDNNGFFSDGNTFAILKLMESENNPTIITHNSAANDSVFIINGSYISE